MPRLRRAQLKAMFCVAIVTAVAVSDAFGGKPQPPPPSPPPPPHPADVYEWRPDLGGMLDTSTNLVWGYEFRALTGGTAPYNYLASQNYPMRMLETADAFYDEADYYYSIGDTELGDHYTQAAFACEDAASYTNWRFPTKSEAQDALWKSLFRYDIEGYSGYYSTPLGPGLAYDGWAPCWTSTPGKPARGGFRTYWTYTPINGDMGEGPDGYSLDVIWVRTHTP